MSTLAMSIKATDYVHRGCTYAGKSEWTPSKQWVRGASLVEYTLPSPAVAVPVAPVQRIDSGFKRAE